jgi:hypothetical protein
VLRHFFFYCSKVEKNETREEAKSRHVGALAVRVLL